MRERTIPIEIDLRLAKFACPSVKWSPPGHNFQNLVPGLLLLRAFVIDEVHLLQQLNASFQRLPVDRLERSDNRVQPAALLDLVVQFRPVPAKRLQVGGIEIIGCEPIV